MYQCCFSSIRGLRVKESGLTLSEQGHPCVCVYVCVCAYMCVCVCGLAVLSLGVSPFT